VVTDIPFWQMVAESPERLRLRAAAVVQAAGHGEVVVTQAVPGAGSAPGTTIPSFGVRVAGDRLAELRRFDPPIIARVRDAATVIDMRTVDPADDIHIADALR
jgi:L-seryl-tRNA(Ser) seleniumtransferase